MSLLESYNATMQSSIADQEMEMVSDSEQAMQYGNEIDLDLDLNPKVVHAEDEDYVLEDATPEPQFDPSNGATEESRDDVMYDEDEYSGIHQATSPHDEELRDVEEPEDTEGINTFAYTTNDLSIPQQDQFLHDLSQQQPTELAIDTRNTDDLEDKETTTGFTHSQQPIEVGTKEAFVAEEIAAEEVQHESEHGQELLEGQYGEDAEDSNEGIIAIEDQDWVGVSSPAVETGQEDVQDVKAKTSTPKSEHAQTLEDPTRENPTSEPEDSHSAEDSKLPLPPIILAYLDNEMSLFPPSNDDSSSTYFLEDENLSEQSINDLFHAFRMVLGESISEDEDLRLHIHDFNLDLDEVSDCLIFEVFVRDI
jgi:hypothetical protein